MERDFRAQLERIDTYEAILDACCDAWNALMAKSEVTASIGTNQRLGTG
jgi:hypothetical protein